MDFMSYSKMIGMMRTSGQVSRGDGRFPVEGSDVCLLQNPILEGPWLILGCDVTRACPEKGVWGWRSSESPVQLSFSCIAPFWLIGFQLA